MISKKQYDEVLAQLDELIATHPDPVAAVRMMLEESEPESVPRFAVLLCIAYLKRGRCEDALKLAEEKIPHTMENNGNNVLDGFYEATAYELLKASRVEKAVEVAKKIQGPRRDGVVASIVGRGSRDIKWRLDVLKPFDRLV